MCKCGEGMSFQDKENLIYKQIGVAEKLYTKHDMIWMEVLVGLGTARIFSNTYIVLQLRER